MTKRIAYLYIIVAASLWGIIGLFVKYLSAHGFTSIQIVAIRSITAAIFLLIYVLIKNRKLLQIKIADSKYFVGTGIISIVFFNWCMFSAIQETSIAISAILLYTAPIFVSIMSRFLFKELFTPRKMLALFITMLGCAFVVGILPNNNDTISMYGLLLGLGSGFFYALYSIFCKYALKKYSSLTITVYTFVFAAVAVTPFSGLWSKQALFLDAEIWLYIVGLSFFSTMLAYILYTQGLKYVETSKASIIATIEPVVATLVSVLVFHEQLLAWQYVGIVLVIAAVIDISLQKNSP
jgi:drug/metabolite transporter (DMT)-like permease